MELFLEFVRVLCWPAVVLIVAIRYRKVIEALAPGTRIKFAISGVEFETTVDTLEHSVTESLRGRKLSEFQWNWLRLLRDNGRMPYSQENYETLRPLRNAGLIREQPEGTLTDADEVEITVLGRLLIDARDRQVPKA